MNKRISYRVNKFVPILTFYTGFVIVFSYVLIYHFEAINGRLGLYLIIVMMLYFIVNILWLALGRIEIKIAKPHVTITKRLLGFKWESKKITKPFNIEIIEELRTNYSFGRSKYFVFYHNFGLKFTDNQENLIYEIGLNDSLEPNEIFDQIN